MAIATSTFKHTSLDFVQTALRMLPWPTEAGLRKIGNPGQESPVLITCNYDLTVRRLTRAMQGHDAWLLVAPSSGINVWCAASGGHLSTHQVVSALKTSGIKEKVSHKRAILPQLAATGVIGREVARRCGWKVRFGPVRAEDIPAYLAAGGHKSEEMRRVRFDTRERMEMAAAWGFPTAAVIALLFYFIKASWAAPLALWSIVCAFALFLFYDRLGEPRKLRFAAATALTACIATALVGGGAAALAAAAVSSLLLTALLTVDYPGSTPLEGGAHFAENAWQVKLDPALCDGVFACWEVCPESCFNKLEDPRKVEISHGERCIRCGACVVQCPKDALFFEDQAGQRIEPDIIRRFKLNLMGSRSVEA